MGYDMNLAIAAIVLVLIAFVPMQMARRKFTEGYFRKYMTLVVISGTFMCIYLIASLVSKIDLGLSSPLVANIKAAGYISEIIAAAIFIKSSLVLNEMSQKYSFKDNAFFEKFKKD